MADSRHQFSMSDLVENDTLFALLSHHVPEIFHFMFSSDGGGAIVNIGLQRS